MKYVFLILAIFSFALGFLKISGIMVYFAEANGELDLLWLFKQVAYIAILFIGAFVFLHRFKSFKDKK
ncbi:hypothetical protein [Kangiella sp. HZ709]|uniref:hypothetical protein n=1 Tax=Kangiella sp. HZ709 TaxID=2666328 RepID=UPI0012AF841D|nr:hypothetical protein [Kangiella sp. HZ709]MRX27696.1 hypothetical protein [Kangiella sp. HZ709]